MNDLINQLVQHHFPQIQAIYLFGSRASDTARPDSDLDLALLLGPQAARRERALALSPCRIALVEGLGCEVDLVNLRRASTVLQNQVINTGQRILTIDLETVLGFEMKVLSAYQKLQEERREILKSFQETGRAYAL